MTESSTSSIFGSQYLDLCEIVTEEAPIEKPREKSQAIIMLQRRRMHCQHDEDENMSVSFNYTPRGALTELDLNDGPPPPLDEELEALKIELIAP